MLSKRNIPITALKNAIDKPLGEKENLDWGDNYGTQSTQNCSGKHAGMLITCKQNGWDMDTYLEMTHPLQIAIKSEIELVAGEKVSTETFDGCGAPLFAILLTGLAKAITTVVKSDEIVYRDIVKACTTHPELVAGEGRLTTRMMRNVPGLFMKEGAEGIEVCALADGRVIAIKTIDGSRRPIAAIVMKVFKRWRIDMPDESVKIYGGSSAVGLVIANI
jgi:L-asparaginase II